MLAFVWTLSLVLAIAAIGIMLVLVVLRFIDDRRDAKRETVRRDLQRALIRFTSVDDVSGLRTVLSRTPPQVIADGAFEFLDLLRGDERAQIERMLAEHGLPDHIRDQLRRGNEAERIRATEMLVPFREARSVESLMQALGDRSTEVRLAAGIALSRMNAQPRFSELLNRIGARSERSHRLIELFRSVPQERLDEIQPLATDLRASASVRAAAVTALSRSDDFRFLADIQKASCDPSGDVAAAAVRALGFCAHPAGAGSVLDAFENAIWEVRAEAATAMGRIGTPKCVEPLGRLLNDAEWRVRYAAGKALKALGGPGEDELRRFAEGPESDGQRTASLALSEGPGK